MMFLVLILYILFFLYGVVLISLFFSLREYNRLIDDLLLDLEYSEYHITKKLNNRR